jgi:3-methyladenine DNA glycosylase AlkD
MDAASVTRDLEAYKNPEKAVFLSRFFKTGKGEYAEGDIFWGLTLPLIHTVVRNNRTLPLAHIPALLESEVHEVRVTALGILVWQFRRGDGETKKRIYDLYLKNTRHINNWDLVDLSAPSIVGGYLLDKPRDVLVRLARSTLLWDRRISALACFTFIKNNDYRDALRISELLLHDKHDLIHKAVGWMLREIGKRDLAVEEAFLAKHYKTMPRTMLRYAIEKFPEDKRQRYLKGTIV